MKKTSVALCFLAFFFCLLSAAIPFGGCKKTVTIYRDTTINIVKDTTILKDTTIGKQMYIALGGFASWQSTSPWILSFIDVPRFNINNFTNVDSVVLVANGYATGGSGTLLLKLYDVTDSTTIGGSTVTITAPEHSGYNPGAVTGFYPFVSSKNFVDSLPKKPIELSLQMVTTDNSTFGDLISAYLILYRK